MKVAGDPGEDALFDWASLVHKYSTLLEGLRICKWVGLGSECGRSSGETQGAVQQPAGCWVRKG